MNFGPCAEEHNLRIFQNMGIVESRDVVKEKQPHQAHIHKNFFRTFLCESRLFLQKLKKGQSTQVRLVLQSHIRWHRYQ